MSERPFMQLYVSDFVGDTLQLSTEQIGAYLMLLMAMWNADGVLPGDDETLSRIARVRVEAWPGVWAKLAPYFDVLDGTITHGRLKFELTKFARKSAARAEAGSRGGKAKALKDKQPGVAIASPLLQHLPETRKKARASASDPTDGLVRLDRYADERVFKACERLTTPVPEYQQFKSWPAEVVQRAKIERVN